MWIKPSCLKNSISIICNHFYLIDFEITTNCDKILNIMKKFLLFLLCLCFCVGFIQAETISAEEVSSTYMVTANSANIFAEPNLSSTKIAVLKHKDIVMINLQNGSPEKTEWQGLSFYKLSLIENNIQSQDYEYGFILCDLVINKGDEILSIPNYNAKTNSLCNVFFKENEVYVKSEITLAKSTEIFLYEGYKSKAKYTAVAFYHENEILYGFLETEYIDPKGINPVLITCAVLIVAVLGVIFAWIFMTRKKVKLRKK